MDLPSDRRFLVICLPLLVMGMALALPRLGSQSLWLDESYTWWFTRLDWGDLLRAARIDAVNPPFYYLSVKAISSFRLGITQGDPLSEAALRFPSVLAQLGGIAAAVFLGWQLTGWVGGLAAGLLWAAHPLTLWAARDARPYALSAALAAAVVGTFFYQRRSNSTAALIVAGTGLAIGLLTHYFFFVLAATLVLLAGADLRRSPTFFRQWTVVTLLALTPLAVWLIWFFSTGSPSLGIGWIRTPLPADIPLTLWNLASGYGGIADHESTLLGLTVVAIAAAGLAGGRRELWIKILLAGLALPIVAVWVLSQRRPVYVDRYFVVLLPFVAALAALGAGAIVEWTARWPLDRRRVFRVGAAAAFSLAALAAASTVHGNSKFDKEDWRGLGAFLQSQNVGPDSLSLSEPEIALPLSYYTGEPLVTHLPALIPECQGLCWWVLRQPYTATHALTQSVAEPGRADVPDVPPRCDQLDAWDSPTGVAAWKINCDTEPTDE